MRRDVLDATLKPAWLDRRTLIRGVVGSTAHGLHMGDALDDRDEMGIAVEPLALRLCPPAEVWTDYVYRTAAAREGKIDARSMAGDLDLTIYSLEKWTRLALAGNPTVLMLLFLPPEMYVTVGPRGRPLLALAAAGAFHSQVAGRKFLGYLTAQRERLLGTRGQKNVNRPELVAQFGYDTKYAMHLLRLGHQGLEFMQTGRLTLPLPDGPRTRLRAVRAGAVAVEEVVAESVVLEQQVAEALRHAPPEPDTARVWAWVRDTYLELWKCEALDAMIAAG